MGTTFWYLGAESNPNSLNSMPLFLREKSAVGFMTAPLWCPKRGEGDELIANATGGISMKSSCGGGCCHWGRGPAKRRFCRSGPASITAFNNLPFLGNGLFTAKFKGNSDFIEFVIGCCFWSCCCRKCFSSSSFWDCVCASFLSLIVLFKASLTWMSSTSRLSISSLADKMAASSSHEL